MGVKKASQLYKEGRFNVANITVNPDGTTTVSCDGARAPKPYTFRARNFLGAEEEVVEDEDIEESEDGKT